MRVFRSVWLLLALVAMLAVGTRGTGRIASTTALADPTTSVIVHYHRFDNSYNGWNLWLWPYAPNAGDGAEYDFDSSDSFGKVAHAQVPGNNTQVGVIVRLNNWD